MTSASRAMDSGAALRARTISAFRSAIKYWSSGAMLRYGVLASCACACQAELSKTTSANPPNAIVPTIFRFIDFPSDGESLPHFTCEMQMIIYNQRRWCQEKQALSAGRSEERRVGKE